MKKALITYLSKTGTTKYFGHNIEKHLKEKGIECVAKSIHDVSPDQVAQYDFLIFGCWTHGLIIAFQHPDREWVKWANQIPNIKNKKIMLFTTYKIAVGGMFKKMAKHLRVEESNNTVWIKSKNENLSAIHKAQLDNFIA